MSDPYDEFLDRSVNTATSVRAFPPSGFQLSENNDHLISGPETSEERVAMRVSQGGHDVPTKKLVSRFPRTLANLKAAIPKLPRVLVFDNDDLAVLFRRAAEFQSGKAIFVAEAVPHWLAPALPPPTVSEASPLYPRHFLSRFNRYPLREQLCGAFDSGFLFHF